MAGGSFAVFFIYSFIYFSIFIYATTALSTVITMTDKG